MESKALISNVLAGVLIAVMNITVAISVAALMFAGTDPAYLGPGIVVLLVGTVIVGLGGTLFSDYSGVVCAPRSGLAPVFATIVGSIYISLHETSPEQVLPTMLVAIMVTSVVTGLFLIALGQLKLGNLVRYIPYPVMGGFFAGIGFIFVKGGLVVAMGHPLGLEVFSDSHLLELGIPALAFAFVLYYVLTQFNHWSTFPLTLLLAFVAFYVVFSSTGQTFSQAALDGWLPQIESSPGILLPVVSLADLGNVNWLAIVSQAGGMLVIALLSAIILLLDISGIEIITRRDLEPDKELRVMGTTNILSGVLGGYPGVHVASDTAFTYKLGGDGRLMGLVYAAVVVLTILAGTDFIGRVPTFVLGGLLVYVGFDFLVDWVWKTRRELPLPDYLIVLAILGVIAFVDILEGVTFGFAVAIVLFVVNYSRLSVIKSEANGRDHASNVDRDLRTREKLNDEGDRILILTLQGFIFFGTSDKLMSEIKQRIEDTSRTRLEFLILDFHHVSQLDTSAIKAFSKLSQLSEIHGFHVVITGAETEMINRLAQINFMASTQSRWKHLLFSQLDDGVAWCEEKILESLDLQTRGINKALFDMLTMMTGDEEPALELAPFFEEENRNEGEFLFTQGQPGNSLYIVGSGSVAVVIESGTQRRVLRRYQAGGVLGEMALYTGDPRSASVVIEEPSVLYRLDVDQLDKMQQKHPFAVGKLHTYIVRLLSERLSRANRELQRYL